MTAGRGFAMVPAWLMTKKPKGNDVLIYCTLASHGSWNPGTGIYESCKPSIDLMVEETGLSRSSVKRALDNLLELKAVKRTLQFTSDGDPAPSLYQVIFGQVVEPDEGVGSQVDRPQAEQKKPRSQGGRSTGGPTSVHGRTEGRSTDEPTVGPQVDRNQEPLNQEPITNSSDPASQGRRTDAEDGDQASGQITIDGKVETPPDTSDRDLQNTAMGIARGWVEFRAEHGCPIVARSSKAPFNAVAALVAPALRSGYTDKEIKYALTWTDTGIPSAHQFDTALGRVKAGWRPPHNWKPGGGHTGATADRQRAGTGAMAGTNRHVDDLTEQQRADENPFVGASRQSDYTTEGAVA